MLTPASDKRVIWQLRKKKSKKTIIVEGSRERDSASHYEGLTAEFAMGVSPLADYADAEAKRAPSRELARFIKREKKQAQMDGTPSNEDIARWEQDVELCEALEFFWMDCLAETRLLRSKLVEGFAEQDAQYMRNQFNRLEWAMLPDFVLRAMTEYPEPKRYYKAEFRLGREIDPKSIFEAIYGFALDKTVAAVDEIEKAFAAWELKAAADPDRVVAKWVSDIIEQYAEMLSGYENLSYPAWIEFCCKYPQLAINVAAAASLSGHYLIGDKVYFRKLAYDQFNFSNPKLVIIAALVAILRAPVLVGKACRKLLFGSRIPLCGDAEDAFSLLPVDNEVGFFVHTRLTVSQVAFPWPYFEQNFLFPEDRILEWIDITLEENLEDNVRVCEALLRLKQRPKRLEREIADTRATLVNFWPELAHLLENIPDVPEERALYMPHLLAVVGCDMKCEILFNSNYCPICQSNTHCFQECERRNCQFCGETTHYFIKCPSRCKCLRKRKHLPQDCPGRSLSAEEMREKKFKLGRKKNKKPRHRSDKSLFSKKSLKPKNTLNEEEPGVEEEGFGPRRKDGGQH